MEQFSKRKILVVEDEMPIRKFICKNLIMNDFKVYECSSGEEALKTIKDEVPELIVLDILLPGIDGFEVCEKVREGFPYIPIIMLTARAQDNDKLAGLKLGADDYIVKPFNPLELIARIEAIFRRMELCRKIESNTIISQNFKLDKNARKFYKNNKQIDLTPKEFTLVKVLMENYNKAVSRDDLLNKAWGKDFFGDFKNVDVTIRRIREKIEEDSSKPKYIETVWGCGYMWIGEVN